MTADQIYRREKKHYRSSKTKLLKAVQYKVKEQTITIIHMFIKTPTKEWTRTKADGKFYCQRRMIIAVDGEVQFSTFTKSWWIE